MDQQDELSIRLDSASPRPLRETRQIRVSGLLVTVHPDLPPAWLNSPIALRPQDVPEGPWRDRVLVSDDASEHIR